MKFIKPTTYEPPRIAELLNQVERSCRLRKQTRHLISSYQFGPQNVTYNYLIRPDVEAARLALQEMAQDDYLVDIEDRAPHVEEAIK